MPDPPPSSRDAVRDELLKKHGLPQPNWTIPSVEGEVFRLRSVREVLEMPPEVAGGEDEPLGGFPEERE